MPNNSLCQCGCEQPAPIARKTNRIYGHVKGQPVRFIVGHYSRTDSFLKVMAAVDPEKTKHVGPNNGGWKGGRFLGPDGYVRLRLGPNQVVREHRHVAETKLGRKLRPGEVVHHVDGNRQNNDPSNIEVFASHSEHMKKHMTTDEARKRRTSQDKTRHWDRQHRKNGTFAALLAASSLSA